MRQGASSWLLKGFLIIIALSFVTWGIGDVFRGTSDPVVAEVGDQEIRVRQLIDAVDNEVQRLRNLGGGDIDFESAREMGVVDRTLDQMISRALIDLEINRLAMEVTTAEIRGRIRRNPAFQNELGAFDQRQFELVLSRNGLTEEQYVNSVRGDIARSRLIETVVSGLEVPGGIARTFHRFRDERRTIEAVVVGAEDVGDVPEPDEAAIAEYYETNEDLFTAPEYRELTFVLLRPADVMDTIDVSEEAMRSLYEARSDTYQMPERRIVDHLYFPDKATAEQAYDRLMRGAEFATVAEEMAALDPDEVSIGAVNRDDLPDEVADDVFSLEEAAVSTPLETNLGWNIYRVTEVLPAQTRSFADVRAELRNELALERAVDVLIELGQSLEDSLAGGATLEEAAQELDLEARHIAAVDRNGLGRYGEPVEGLPDIENFLEVAFETPEGLESLLTEARTGNTLYVVRVDQIIEPGLRPLEQVRDDVIAAVKEERRVEKAGELAAEIASDARAGGDLAAAAAKHGLELVETEPFTRSGERLRMALSRQALNTIFDLRQGEISEPVEAGPKSYAVARVVDIEVPAFDENGSPALAVRNSLRTAMQRDLLQNFELALRQRHDISVQRDVINSFF